MDAIIFLLILVAAITAIRSKKTWVVLLAFAVAVGFAVALFLHHVTDPLGVSL